MVISSVNFTLIAMGRCDGITGSANGFELHNLIKDHNRILLTFRPSKQLEGTVKSTRWLGCKHNMAIHVSYSSQHLHGDTLHIGL